MNDCCTSARGHPLAVPPSVNPFDQLRLDADIDVCGFALHAGEIGRCRAYPLDNFGQKIDKAGHRAAPRCCRLPRMPWAEEAARLGWSEVDLFGVDADRPYTRLDGMGLVPALDGCKIVALSAEGAVLETTGGARQSYRRKPEQPGRALVWKIGS